MNIVKVLIANLTMFSLMLNTIASENRTLKDISSMASVVEELNLKNLTAEELVKSIKQADENQVKKIEAYLNKYPSYKNQPFPKLILENNQLSFMVDGQKVIVSFYDNSDIVVSSGNKKADLKSSMSYDEIEVILRKTFSLNEYSFIKFFIGDANAIGHIALIAICIGTLVFITVHSRNAMKSTQQAEKECLSSDIIKSNYELQVTLDKLKELSKVEKNTLAHEVVSCLSEKIKRSEDKNYRSGSKVLVMELDPASLPYSTFAAKELMNKNKLELRDATPKEFKDRCIGQISREKEPKKVLVDEVIKGRDKWPNLLFGNTGSTVADVKQDATDNSGYVKKIIELREKYKVDAKCKTEASSVVYLGNHTEEVKGSVDKVVKNGGVCVSRYGFLRNDPCKNVDFGTSTVSEPTSHTYTTPRFSLDLNYECRIKYEYVKTEKKSESEYSKDACNEMNSCIEKAISENDIEWLLKNEKSLKAEGKAVCKNNSFIFNVNSSVNNNTGRGNAKPTLNNGTKSDASAEVRAK